MEVQLIRVAAFLATVVAIFIAAAIISAHWLWKRSRKQPAALSRKSRFVLALAGVGVLCILYAHYIEPMWPEVTHVTVETAKFRNGSRGIRIVAISDVHSDGIPHLEPKLPGIIAEQSPDIIVFTGDSVN